MKILSFILFAISLTAHAQSGGDWSQFASNNGQDHSFNMSRIKRDNYGVNTYTAWWKIKFPKPDHSLGKNAVFQISLYRVGCDDQTLSRLQTDRYNASGVVVYSDPRESFQVRAIPNTLGEAFVEEVCAIAPSLK